jgi:hypothetical protein
MLLNVVIRIFSDAETIATAGFAMAGTGLLSNRYEAL